MNRVDQNKHKAIYKLVTLNWNNEPESFDAINYEKICLSFVYGITKSMKLKIKDKTRSLLVLQVE